MIENGFYKSLKISDYLKEDALSKSGLSDLAISPAHFKARRLESKTFEGASLGTALHALVLEPERAERIIFTPPDSVLGKNGARSTNAYREWVAAQDAGAVILSRDEFESAHFMKDAILSHPRAAELLQGGNPEVSAFITLPDETRLKVRPDYLTDGPITDLKTTVDASPEGFGKQAFNLKYYWSAYLTTKVVELLGGGRRDYHFFAVEKSAPYCAAVYSTPPELLELAEREIEPLITLYRVCAELGVWGGYSEEIMPLQIPALAVKKING